jgi:adenylylsulfate kinase-like enzyme
MMSTHGIRPEEVAPSSNATLGFSIGDTADNQVEVLFLTGQPGAGKTAVAKELSELLWQLREPHAVIDLDELCRGLLPTPTRNYNRALALANLTAVWANFHAAGVRRLILARMIESLDDLDQFGNAIAHAQLTVCVLQAPTPMIEQRITGREPGTARRFLLSATTRIAAQMAGLDLPGICVDNGQRSISEVAREILEHVHWPCPPA